MAARAKQKRRDQQPEAAGRAQARGPGGNPLVITMRLVGVAIGVLGFARWLQGNAFTLTALGEPMVAIALIIGIAAALGERADSTIASLRASLLRPSPRLFVAALAALTLCLSLFFAWFCLHGKVWVVDEATQRWQARLLLSGRLWIPAEPLREFFETRQTATIDGRWFGEFSIGGPLLMAVGEWMRAPWLTNPLMASVCVATLYRFFSRTTDEVTARATTLLFALSPFMLFMSASEMTHPKSLAGMLVALCGLVEWSESADRGRRRWGAVAIGTGIGWIVLIRPYDAVLIALPIGIYQLWAVRRGGGRAGDLLWQAAVGVFAAFIVLATNRATTGAWTQFTYDVINGPAHQPGFHTDPSGFPFTPGRGLTQLSLYMGRLNTLMLEWPIPSIALIVVSLVLRSAATRWDALMAGLLVSVCGGYWAYWHFGDAFGPRFLFPLLPFLLFVIAQFPRAVAGVARQAVARRAAVLAIPCCMLVAWIPGSAPGRFTGVWKRASDYRAIFVPSSDVRAQLSAARDSDRLALAFPDVDKEIASAHLDHALVFVREAWYVRLATRLRLLGETPFGADRVIADLDGCVLHEALDREDSVASGTAEERLTRVIQEAVGAGRGAPDPSLPPGADHVVFAPGRSLSQSCRDQIAGDSVGTVPLWYFLPYTRLDSTGRVGGPVVFVRDLGAHNEALRTRFGDRVWYRYHRFGDRGVFEPYR